MFGMFGPGMPGMGGGGFEALYRAMPVAFIDKQQAEFGDKVILPPSALDRLGEWCRTVMTRILAARS